MDVTTLVLDLLIVLAAGLVSGMVCKRWGVSLLVGYLIVGAVIGEGGLGWVSQENRELEYLARAGALLMLFSVGIEFSLAELARLSRYLLVGGTTQMAIVAAVVFGVTLWLGWERRPAVLLASAATLSSTVLVFKALAEWGQVASPHGKRAVGILLFQDAALVPLMLLVPLLTGEADAPGLREFALLAVKSAVFVGVMLAMRRLIAWGMVPLLARLRSVELVVLFTLAVLAAASLGASALELPPAIGALAAGLMLSGNRLSHQIDTLILPYRESFSAVFFVTLGTFFHPSAFLDEPLLLAGGLLFVLLLKAAAAAIALRLVGLNWRASLGMGLGLAQLGEFSFLLIAEGLGHGVIDRVDYNRMLFIALGTLIVTPQLLKFGLRWSAAEPAVPDEEIRWLPRGGRLIKSIVIGVGPIGRQIASRLELMGVGVCLIDLSPVNLYGFSQQGFHTVAGDARDPDVLCRADVAHCRLVVVSVPDDDIAREIVRTLRELNPQASLVVRCRYVSNIAGLTQAGAHAVVSEEAEASGALLGVCTKLVAGEE